MRASITAEKIIETCVEDGELYKYVRVNGEYRFCDPTFWNHIDLLNTGEVGQSAGFFSYSNYKGIKKIKLFDDPSTTLGLWPQEEDEDNIKKLFGL